MKIDTYYVRNVYIVMLRILDFNTLTTKHRCRTRSERSKSAILLDNDARHNPMSPCVFCAQQHLCKRLSALAVLTGPD